VFLGPADYVSHEGGRPMAITWRLRQADADWGVSSVHSGHGMAEVVG
jgi:hypothetical protein